MITDVLNWLYTAKTEWVERNIDEITVSDLQLFNDLLDEEKFETLRGIQNSDRNEVLDGVVDMMWIVLNLAAMCGISPEELENYAKKVSESNWSKFDNSKEDAIKTHTLYGNGTHPDKLGEVIHTKIKQVGDKFVNFRMLDGKILKSYKYKKLT